MKGTLRRLRSCRYIIKIQPSSSKSRASAPVNLWSHVRREFPREKKKLREKGRRQKSCRTVQLLCSPNIVFSHAYLEAWLRMSNSMVFCHRHGHGHCREHGNMWPRRPDEHHSSQLPCRSFHAVGNNNRRKLSTTSENYQQTQCLHCPPRGSGRTMSMNLIPSVAPACVCAPGLLLHLDPNCRTPQPAVLAPLGTTPRNLHRTLIHFAITRYKSRRMVAGCRKGKVDSDQTPIRLQRPKHRSGRVRPCMCIS